MTNSQKAVPCPKCGKSMTVGGIAGSGSVRWRCRTGGVYCYSTTNPGMSKQKRNGNTSARPLRFFRAIDTSEVSRFIVTSAQNATPVHKQFFEALKVAAKHLDAELIIIPIRYKNPTSRWTASQAGAEWWVEETHPYLYNARKKLNQNLVLLGDVKAQPTASSPLTGFEGLTGGESAIIGHTKLQLKVIPVPAGKFPKIITTTGACTVANYTDTKAGKLGEFHHTLGAALVEIKGKHFHLRQISADVKDGSFTDADKSYTADGVYPAPPALALIMGDVHVDVIDPKVDAATFGTGGIVDVLKPQNIIYHDLIDGVSHNPHEKGNVFLDIAKRAANMNDVAAEVRRACKYVQSRTPKGVKAVIVNSNHNDFLRRWIVNTDWRQDGDARNAEFYLETALEMVRGSKMEENGASYPSPFNLWAKRLIKNVDALILDGDQSYTVAGIEMGLHGDRGPNGARGSAANLSRLGVKTVVGHSHVPQIAEGCWQTGTSSFLRLGYNSGPSSWLNSHIVVYASGKRCLITICDGQWKV